MFHTFPDAESPIPKGLAQNGERSWLWLEFGLYIPYFLVAIRVESETEKDVIPMTRHLFLTRVDQILDLDTQQNSAMQILSLSLMSPGYMNKGDDYQLAQVKEVWACEENGGHKFVLSDGRDLSFPECTADMDFKLVFSLQS